MKGICRLFMSVFLLWTVCISCSLPQSGKKEGTSSFDDFDFSYSAESLAFSIRFTGGDTVYIRHTFILDTIPFAKDRVYAAVLPHKDRQKLDSLVKDIDFSHYHHLPQGTYRDGQECAFYVKKDGAVHEVLFVF